MRRGPAARQVPGFFWQKIVFYLTNGRGLVYNGSIIKKEASSMNTIVTIGRQFGSGGREIGIRLAKALDVPFYDKELLRKAA